MSKDREELCQKVVTLAARILSEEGPEGLTVRKIAQESGASTQLIYTLFGGKFGLVDGLYKEGFSRMVTFMKAKEDTSDPRRNLENMILGYREFAFQHKPFYTVMFTRPVAEYTPPPESLEMAWGSFAILVNAIQNCQANGHVKEGDAMFIARSLWSHMHGVVSLELIGHLWEGAGEKIYRQLIEDMWN